LKKSIDIPGRVAGAVIIDIADGTPADGILMKGDVSRDEKSGLAGLPTYAPHPRFAIQPFASGCRLCENYCIKEQEIKR
jgi:hypothetical protein